MIDKKTAAIAVLAIVLVVTYAAMAAGGALNAEYWRGYDDGIDDGAGAVLDTILANVANTGMAVLPYANNVTVVCGLPQTTGGGS